MGVFFADLRFICIFALRNLRYVIYVMNYKPLTLTNI